jgi:2,3-bisphosphoglycerate-independent phosphoglycerate mutase
MMTKASVAGYTVLISADHGNCELMINPSNKEINKEHTGSPVPLVVADLQAKPFTLQGGNAFTKDSLVEYSSNPTTGILADIAPTVLFLMGVEKPAEMSGIDISTLI